MSEQKIIDGLSDAANCADCCHVFVRVKPHKYGAGVSGVCIKCRCRMTAWPGTSHYDDLAAVLRAHTVQ